MNSIRRGAPVPTAPALMMLVIRPKLPLTAGGLPARLPMLPEGLLNTGWFSRLYAAARKFSRRRSVRLKRFCRELSNYSTPRSFFSRSITPRVRHVRRRRDVKSRSCSK